MYGVTATSLHHYPHAFTAASNYGHFASQSPFSGRSGAAGSLASVYGSGYPDWGLGVPGSASSSSSASTGGLLGHHSRDPHDYLSPCAVSTSSGLHGRGNSPTVIKASPSSHGGNQQPQAGQTFPVLYPGYLGEVGGTGGDKVGALSALCVSTALKEAAGDSKPPGQIYVTTSQYTSSSVATLSKHTRHNIVFLSFCFAYANTSFYS